MWQYSGPSDLFLSANPPVWPRVACSGLTQKPLCGWMSACLSVVIFQPSERDNLLKLLGLCPLPPKKCPISCAAHDAPRLVLKRLTLAGLHGLDTALPHGFPASWASPCDASQSMRTAVAERVGGTAWHAAGATKCGPVWKVVPRVWTCVLPSPSTAQLSPSKVALTKQNVKVSLKKKKKKDNVRRHVTTNVDHNEGYSMTCSLKQPSLGAYFSTCRKAAQFCCFVFSSRLTLTRIMVAAASMAAPVSVSRHEYSSFDALSWLGGYAISRLAASNGFKALVWGYFSLL